MLEFGGYLILAYGAMRLLQQDFWLGALLVLAGLAIIIWKHRIR